MLLIFLYGPLASGKLTIAKVLAERTGFALFHNHLIVDAVAAVFPFGSESFVRLREAFWLETIAAAVAEDRSLIFTFAPEPTVSPDFAARVAGLVADGGGQVVFVALTLAPELQDQRVAAPDRAAFGKLRSVDLLRELRPSIHACIAGMPAPALTIDTGAISPETAAERIVAALPG
ncbi:shikimate kinase [Sphingomonas sp. AOB5]|uniref:shikimate kinase n=1 Tax=Sphingomonas sp. AOB5 TaxID=3034017 RepID=UPI0023F6303A|nr:shikimate kinase [Sphingomonas sp. AOB5]MDF7776583.1 shikimate kinase [Sphingomonas sp. AOB5]